MHFWLLCTAKPSTRLCLSCILFVTICWATCSLLFSCMPFSVYDCSHANRRRRRRRQRRKHSWVQCYYFCYFSSRCSCLLAISHSEASWQRFILVILFLSLLRIQSFACIRCSYTQLPYCQQFWWNEIVQRKSKSHNLPASRSKASVYICGIAKARAIRLKKNYIAID